MLTIAIMQLSHQVNPMNIAQRSWVTCRYQLPFSCQWAPILSCHTEVLCHVVLWRNCNHSIAASLEAHHTEAEASRSSLVDDRQAPMAPNHMISGEINCIRRKEACGM